MNFASDEHFDPVLPDFQIKGSRILLRPPQVQDEGEWIALRKRNKEYLKPFEPGWSRDALSSGFFQRRIVRQRKDWANDRAYSFLIFRHAASPDERPKMIGGININNVCRGAAQFASLGYWLDEWHQGQGYMRAAMRMIIYFSYNELKLNRLNASVLPDNEKSKNLLLHVGFEEEGFAKSYIEINHKWEDHILYGLVLEDFMQAEQEKRK